MFGNQTESCFRDSHLGENFGHGDFEAPRHMVVLMRKSLANEANERFRLRHPRFFKARCRISERSISFGQLDAELVNIFHRRIDTKAKVRWEAMNSVTDQDTGSWCRVSNFGMAGALGCFIGGDGAVLPGAAATV